MNTYNCVENHIILPGNFYIRYGYKLILKENNEETTFEYALFIDNDFRGILVSLLDLIDELIIVQLYEVSYIFTFDNNLYENIGNCLFIHVLGDHSQNYNRSFFFKLKKKIMIFLWMKKKKKKKKKFN